MKATAILIRMSGQKDAVEKAASKQQTLHQVEGKVVRRYTAAAAPDPLPDDADVIIIVETT